MHREILQSMSYNSLADMVVEEEIPDMSTLLMMFGDMVPAQRPLR